MMTETLFHRLERLAMIVLFVATAGAGHAAGTPPLDQKYGVVLPAAAAKRLLHQCSRGSPRDVTGIWIPDAAQVRDLEARLPRALSDALASRKNNKDRSAEIARQYAGLVIGGRKVIYVNAFPRSVTAPSAPDMSPPDWKHEPIMVCDGGAVFFGVEYDPEKKTFADFEFNGAI